MLRGTFAVSQCPQKHFPNRENILSEHHYKQNKTGPSSERGGFSVGAQFGCDDTKKILSRTSASLDTAGPASQSEAQLHNLYHIENRP